MSTIASARNPRLKALRRLHRRRDRERSGTFLAEGEDLVEAAQLAGWNALEGYRAAGSGGTPAGFQEVEGELLAGASTLGSGTRVLAVYEQRWSAPAGPLCVYLHGLRDPGNVGTIIRSAHAFGASCVALGPGCADPYGPKAVRASMGAIFTVPLARAGTLGELPGELLALSADAGEELRGPLREIAPAVTLLVGAERTGLPAEVLDACRRRARITIAGDSLNAAMAATVALYELTRKPSRVRAS
ncbi:MAG TPA: RNA methyltransferase [Solirubrobacteraceae bacterium]|nr:RNA methyltransferase [Solirubrobacteraceae bacterium]